MLADLYSRDEERKSRVGRLLSLKAVLESPDKKKISRVRDLEPAVLMVIGGLRSRWVYAREGLSLPRLVTDVEFNEGERDNPANVRVSLSHFACGEMRGGGFSVFTEDLKGGKTVTEVFLEHGYFLQNNILDARYEGALKKYEEWWNLSGVQFRVLGAGIKDHYSQPIPLGQGGQGERVVLDYEITLEKDEESNRRAAKPRITSAQSWGGEFTDDNDDDEHESFPLPIHPYVYCFHLAMHVYFWVHVSHLKPYVYQPELKEKLILPTDHSDLVDVLTTESVLLKEDIIEGKAGGTTILCQGDPGTGKTLTAEVYAEVTRKPLYKLHSGQLGTDPKSVEEELTAALRRAERWKAVMLIDEADVYVRSRAQSLEQNAVVGVFLRTLEYFNGLLFMTTNRAQDIDDAILSRCIAVIQYQKPAVPERERLWAVLSEQFGLKMSPALCVDAAELFTNVSGRDIKAFLKLASKWCEVRKVPLTLKVLEKAAVFRGYSAKKISQ